MLLQEHTVHNDAVALTIRLLPLHADCQCSIDGIALVTPDVASHAQAMNTQYKAVIAIGTERHQSVVCDVVSGTQADYAAEALIMSMHCHQCALDWCVDASCSIREGGSLQEGDKCASTMTQDYGREGRRPWLHVGAV